MDFKKEAWIQKSSEPHQKKVTKESCIKKFEFYVNSFHGSAECLFLCTASKHHENVYNINLK